MSDNLDTELLSLINRLNKIQSTIGGKTDKALGKEQGKISKFQDLRFEIVLCRG